MKYAIMLLAAIAATTNTGVATAQTAGKIVAPAISAETSRVISGAVSRTANDALKTDHKSKEMTGKTKKVKDGVKRETR